MHDFTTNQRAVISFFWWCEAHDRHALRELRPVDIAAYVEEMATHRAAPTVKQHLAAIRILRHKLPAGMI